MVLFNKHAGGTMDQIRCDEPNYLIWKWHPTGSQGGDTKRETAIRWGSSLRVREGSAAAFVYTDKDGSPQDFIEGPFDEILKTSNLPVIASIIGTAYDGGTPFQAEVYFINLAQVIQVKFAVPFFDVYDPRFLDFGVPTAARGTITFKITDYHEFIKLHRLDGFTLDDFRKQVRDAITRYVKDAIANAPSAYNVPLIQLERKITDINDAITPKITERLLEKFGVTVTGVDLAAIEFDKSSAGYKSLMAVTRDIASETTKAQADVNIKNLHDMQQINAGNTEATLKAQREEAQYAQRKTTESANFAAYQVEQQAAVGIAGANALGQMGANGGTTMSIGGGGSMDPAAMMAGMAVGGAVGRNIADTMGEMMQGVNQPTGAVPPPVPVTAYNIAVNGQPTGPYDLNTLTQMALSGIFGKDSLVWKAGMANWEQASAVDELGSVFAAMPPIPSTVPPIPSMPQTEQGE